ncbi:MAG: DUF6259 domain-containing protein [Armatimonadota bacterium]
MYRAAIVAFTVMIALTSTAVAQDWEIGWAEEFEDTEGADRWYPIAYTRNCARDFSFAIEDGVGHFHVGEPRRAMRWMTTPSGVNLDTYDTLEIRYRAINQQDESDSYFLYMNTNPTSARPSESPVTLGELQADGEWHVLRKEMPRKRDGGYWATKFVLSVNATDGPADVWVDYIRLEGERPPLREVGFTDVQVAARHDFDDLAGWEQLEDVPYPGVGSMNAEGGTAEFAVEGMQRNASFAWSFDEPIEVGEGVNTVVFRYRIRGQRLVYTRNPRTIRHFMTVGAGDEERGIYLWNSLINDGAWHMAANTFPTDAFPDGLEHVRINLVSEESPRAWAELDWIYVGSGRELANLRDRFEVTQDPAIPEGRDFQYIGVPPTEGVTASGLMNRYHGMYMGTPGGRVALDGVPFELSEDAHVLGVMDREELTVPVGGTMPAVYALVATRPEGLDNFTYWGGPIKSVYEPERFRIRLDYVDGGSFESLPANIAGGSYVMPPGPGLLGVVNPHPEREVASLSLVDGTRAVGFHVLGITLQRSGEPLFEMPEAGRPLPPQSRVTDRAPDDHTEIEVGEGQGPVTLRSDYLTLELDLADGIRPSLMFSGILTQDLSPVRELFTLETEDGSLTSAEVTVTGAERVSPTLATVDWTAEESMPVSGRLTLQWNDASEIGMTVGVTNEGDEDLRGSLTVTPMPGVVIDSTPENVWTFYPGFGTMISNEPFFEDEVKADRLPVGMVTAWSPEKGGGLYVAGHDNEPRYDADHLLEKYTGRVTAATRYLYLDVAPGATAALPEVAVGAYLGDYTTAVAAYRDWMATWYTPSARHPEWFRRISTFIGITPTLAMFLDEDGRMDLSPHIEGMAEHFGPIDYQHVYGWFTSPEHGGQGDYSHYEYLGGEEAWRGALQGLEDAGVRTGLYLDPLLMDEKAEAAEVASDWKLVGEDGEVRGWSAGNFYTCSAIPECRDYWANTYERVGRTFPASGLYMDQVGYWNADTWVCWNPEHDHPVPVGMRVAQAPLVREIREAVNRVGHDVVTYSEFVPTEIMTQWQDGAFNHTHRYEWERPSTFLVNPIYWVAPQVKCFELYAGNANNIWENVRLSLRALWGRETLYMAGEPTEYAPETAAAIRRIGEVWRSYPEAFATTEPEWLVPTLRQGVYANRFPGDGYEVYTIFNDLPYTADGALIEIPHREGATYREAWEDVVLEAQIEGEVATIFLTIPPKQVRVVVAR